MERRTGKMARALNGSLTGAAASIDLRDFHEYLQTSQDHEIHRKRILIDGLMRECYELEGDTFVTWWDDELPPVIRQDEQIRLLRERIEKNKGEQS
jgi:hypothetical protein